MRIRLILVTAVLAALTLLSVPNALAKGLKPVSTKKFDQAAQAALAAMKSHANQLNMNGVAVVALAEGDTIRSWRSEMLVVGTMTDKKSDKGNNLLAIAYAKASEMAETLKDSGTAGKPPMVGEFGWEGGVIAKTAKGYIIVAFSGGKSEDDVATSRVGLEILKSRL